MRKIDPHIAVKAAQLAERPQNPTAIDVGRALVKLDLWPKRLLQTPSALCERARRAIEYGRELILYDRMKVARVEGRREIEKVLKTADGLLAFVEAAIEIMDAAERAKAVERLHRVK